MRETKEYTLKEAFLELLKDTKACEAIGINKHKRHDYRTREVSDSLMRDILYMAGFRKYQHETFVKIEKGRLEDCE